jgi:galactose mutarotase-like enzyme
MKVLTNNLAVRQEQGFEVYVLSNREVEVAVVPELGAKIISVKNLCTGREWLWHPIGGPTLFHNGPGDDFSRSPLVGVDECLPTIEPCVWRGRKIPDHGEVWSSAWNVDEETWQKGALKTSVRLEISPFDFERTIELDETEVRFNYQLSNRSSSPEYFLWAMHPLLRLREDDRLVLPQSTRNLLNGETWVDAIDSGAPTGNCVKLIAGPLSEGAVGIHNQKTGDRFEFNWDPAENNALGLWLTRGGWHGHHHFALEPTNAGADSLIAAVRREWCGILAGSGTASWQVRLRIGR